VSTTAPPQAQAVSDEGERSIDRTNHPDRDEEEREQGDLKHAFRQTTVLGPSSPGSRHDVEAAEVDRGARRYPFVDRDDLPLVEARYFVEARNHQKKEPGEQLKAERQGGTHQQCRLRMERIVRQARAGESDDAKNRREEKPQVLTPHRL
jgi:hypothetical protein